MMFILTVIVGFFLMFIGALFTGWIYELVYKLAIIPIVSCFNVAAPDIPFMLFVLLSLGITAWVTFAFRSAISGFQSEASSQR